MANVCINATPWSQQFAINTNPATSISGWVNGSLSGSGGGAEGCAAFITNGRLFTVGGTYSAAVRSAPIDGSGNLGAFVAGTDMPSERDRAQAILTCNRVYIIGGHKISGMTRDILTAPIYEDGTLGAWSTLPDALPEGRDRTVIFIDNDVLYVVGGFDSTWTARDTVYQSTITDGVLGAFSTGTPLAYAVASPGLIKTGSHVYLAGGTTGPGMYTANKQRAVLNGDGTLGAWASDGTIETGAASYCLPLVTASRAWLIGGGASESGSNAVRTAPITDGVLGAFSADTALCYEYAFGATLLCTSSTVYLFGQMSGSVTSAPFTGSADNYLPLSYTGAAPLPSFSADGNCAEPVNTLNGTFEHPKVADGNCAEPVSTLSGTFQYTTIGFGNCVEPLPAFNGTVKDIWIGFGNCVAPKDKVKGEGAADGRMVERVNSVSATFSTAYSAQGRCVAPVDAIAGAAAYLTPYLASGGMKEPKPTLSASVYESYYFTARCTQPRDRIGGTFHLPVTAHGSLAERPNTVRGRFATAAQDSAVLSFRRDSPQGGALQEAPPPAILHFNRY